MPRNTAQSALDRAWHLVRKGEVKDARIWAAEASNQDPYLEEAWLIQAATSEPNESFEYLRKALEINPRSRRGNKGVNWAESKTGRSYSDYVRNYNTPVPEPEPFQPFEGKSFTEIDLAPLELPSSPTRNDPTFELPRIQADSFGAPYQRNFNIPSYSEPEPLPEPVIPAKKAEPVQPPPPISSSPPPVDEFRTIIRKKKPNKKPVEPENPYAVLLPYTVSFIIFLFMVTLWLLSGLPSVTSIPSTPGQTTDELVSQILTANPKPTVTVALTATSTPVPQKTPTKLPTITLTFTPLPSATPVPPTGEPVTNETLPYDPDLDDSSVYMVADGNESPSYPILIGDQIVETLDDGRWIDVNLQNQVVKAYARDILIREFVVSTGVAAHPTVKGDFHIYIKDRYADMRGPGYYLPNVPYTMYFYQSYGLHGTYWHHNFGTPMSHGCVNLKTEDAQWLFHWASLGTLVHVH
jgi:lipoprotein-anchoring transpeptidase ErfK/SrfK